MINDVDKNSIEFYKSSDVCWKGLETHFVKALENKGIGNVQEQSEFNDLFSYVFPFQNLTTQISIWSYYKYIQTKDTYKILEKTQALLSNNSKYDFNPSLIESRPFNENDKILNWDYLISIDTIQTLAEKTPNILTDQINICEIGAGWGRIAYYLTQLNSKLSYYVFDIPHTLLIAHEYLLENTNHIKVFNYNDSKKLGDKIPGIYFLTPHFLEDFKPKYFDITINIASFQEMSQAQVKGYLDIINKTSSLLYTQQRYKDLEMSYDKYEYPLNWEKLIDKDVNFHPLWFEQMFKIY